MQKLLTPRAARKFANRTAAGRELAARLHRYADRPDVLVLGLPRGGIVVAYQIAAALRAPLDALLVRRLVVPGEEVAFGATALGGWRVFNEDVIRYYDLDDETIDEISARELLELERRDDLYRAGRPAPAISKRLVVLADDGLATGATMRAAVYALTARCPAGIVVAVPVGAPDVCDELRCDVDRLVCLAEPPGFAAVGEWYESFEPIGDVAVRVLLDATRENRRRLRLPAARPPGALLAGPAGARSLLAAGARPAQYP